MTAIVLAGGLGTRLRGVLPDLPKPLAPVNGRPFLAYVLDWLRAQGECSAVLAVSYLHERIEAFAGTDWQGMAVRYSVETEPLGTGGGLAQAFEQVEGDCAVVVNADTWFPIDIPALLGFHRKCRAQATLALAAVGNVQRYGAVDIHPGGRIAAFLEKGEDGAGLINGGVYVLQRALLTGHTGVFSLERDVLQPGVDDLRLYGMPCAAPFLDIGIPEDLARANNVLEAK